MLTVLVTATRMIKSKGVEYWPGDEFPFNPQDEMHRLLWQQRALDIAVVEPDAEPKAVQRGNKRA